MTTTSREYLRIDLWRYIRVPDDEIRDSFRFTRRVIKYICYLAMIVTTTLSLLCSITCTGSRMIAINILNAIFVSYILDGNVVGDMVLRLCDYNWIHRFKIEDELEVYDTRKVKRYTRFLVKAMYAVISGVLLGIMGYIIRNGGIVGIDSTITTIIFWLDFYLFIYWVHWKHVCRRFNLVFGV